MNIYILEGNFDKAKEIGNRVLMTMNRNSSDLFNVANFDLNYTYNYSHLSFGDNSSDQFELQTEQISIK